MAFNRAQQMKTARATPGDHAGPDGKFPVFDDQSAKAAWNLRGHSADPIATGARVKAIAKKKGFLSALPKSAQ